MGWEESSLGLHRAIAKKHHCSNRGVLTSKESRADRWLAEGRREGKCDGNQEGIIHLPILTLPPSLLHSFPLISGEEVKGKIRNFNETIELQVGREERREGRREKGTWNAASGGKDKKTQPAERLEQLQEDEKAGGRYC